MYIRQDERHGFGGARVEVLGDARRGTASAGAEVDADGGGECVGAEFAVEEGGADLGGAAGEEDGDAGVPDEGEGVLDAGSEEGMEPGGGMRLAEVGHDQGSSIGTDVDVPGLVIDLKEMHTREKGRHVVRCAD